MLVKFNRPTNLDKAKYKTILLAKLENGEQEFWINLSEEEDKPEWHRLGDIMECAFSKRFYTEPDCFIEDVLQSYNYYLMEQESKKEN